jgi:hypothetical protein
MARGWESKSVEAQQEEAATQSAGDNKVRLTAEQAETRRKRDSLLLSRKDIEQKMATATNPRYREMLEAALAEVQARLAER